LPAIENSLRLFGINGKDGLWATAAKSRAKKDGDAFNLLPFDTVGSF
jgi:hypothetical protein